MNDKERYEKAVRLCEGGIVEVNGLFVRSRTVARDFHPCDACDMDSICHDNVMELCAECDKYDSKHHYLVLASR